MEVAHIDAFHRDPDRFWHFYSQRFMSLRDKRPNRAHEIVAELEQRGLIQAVITQNIDRLHQRAGIPEERLIEIHGHSGEGRCLDCRRPMPLETVRAAIESTGASPRCRCGGLVKAAVVSFGEQIPPEILRGANEIASRADLFLVIGSSLQVQPAATLPLAARRAGASLAIINREATPLDGSAEIVLRRSIGAVFSTLYPQLVNSAFGSF